MTHSLLRGEFLCGRRRPVAISSKSPIRVSRFSCHRLEVMEGWTHPKQQIEVRELVELKYRRKHS